MSYAALVKLSAQAAELTASACASCAVNDPYHHCCKGCAFAQGYLGVAYDELNAIKLKYGWDKSEGFATNKGCRLPREIRSPICLAFYCNPIKQSKHFRWKGEGDGLQRMRDDKGFKDAVLPDKFAALLYRAMADTAEGHRQNIALVIEGRNSI